jgi:peroxiredoxin Q/BCP
MINLKKNLHSLFISDEHEELCKYFNVLKLKKNYGKEYIGIERSTFLFKQGNFIKEWRNIKVAEHVSAVIKVIKNN